MSLRCLLPFVLLLAALTLKADLSIDSLFNDKQTALWDLTPVDINKIGQGKKIFDWTDSTKNCLSYQAKLTPLFFADISLNELRVFFEKGKAVKFEGNLYNRADNGDLDREIFLNRLQQLGNIFKKFSGVEGSQKTSSLIGGSKIFSRYWQNDRFRLTLRWSFSGGTNRSTFQSEFISFQVSPKGDSNSMEVTKNVSGDLKSRVINKDNGDCLLEVPMVDQGGKSYCVVAATERVLKYYGSEVDQYMLAQLAKASPLGGTNMDEMMKVMRKAGAKLRFRFKELYLYKDMMSASGVKRMIGDYNRVAAKEKKSKLSSDPAHWNYNFALMLKSIDPEVFKAMRAKDREFKQFQLEVKDNITKGMPILWGVMLGIVKEKDLPQVMGGHMRLIVGFNDKDKQIIYSDSWGKDHAFKKMSWEDAWGMTLMTVICYPRSGKS